MYFYTVRCKIADSKIAETWLAWLIQEHVQDVCESGAGSAEIFKMDSESVYEVRYQFASRSEFEKYERDHAPRLRQEGLATFPIELGLEYARTSGERIWEFKNDGC